MSSKLILLSVYFSPFPNWFPAFLMSCRYNPEMEWLIVSDNPTPPNCPENVRILTLDVAAFNQLASQKLGMNIRLDPSFPYKLVDIKPAYGKIFEDYLHKCDFWGFCDIDIIWGDMQQFLSPHLLEQVDVYTTKIGKIAGHFCLFRNVPEMNLFFMNIPNITAMFEDQRTWRVDECYLTPFLQQVVQPSWRQRIKTWFRPVGVTKPRVYWEKSLTTPGKQQKLVNAQPHLSFRWKQGKAFDVQGKEVMYLHFHLLKKTIQEVNFGYWDAPTELVITASSILMPTDQ